MKMELEDRSLLRRSPQMNSLCPCRIIHICTCLERNIETPNSWFN